MARAKHRDRIAQREHEAFLRRIDRQVAHEALLAAHKEYKKAREMRQK
jgi:hypothetical protein